MKIMAFFMANSLAFLALLLLLAAAYAQGSDEYLISDWGYTPNTMINKVYIDDLNADGVNELIASSRDGVVYDLGKNPKGHLYWQTNLGGDLRAFAVADFDRDGKKEILAGADVSKFSLKLMDWQGINKGSTIEFEKRVYAVDAADVDGDGKMDAVVGASNGGVYVIKSAETPLWEYISKGPIYYVHASDIDGDGKTEVVALSLWSENEDELAQVFALDKNGKRLWVYDVPGGISPSAPFPVEIVDLNGDGKREVAVGTKSRGVDVLGSDGGLLWNFQTEKRVGVVYAADLQKTGRPAIVAGATPYIYALDAGGKQLWKAPVNTTILSIHASDINSDGRLEILAGANKYIYILSDSGRPIYTWSYRIGSSETKNVDVRSIYAGDLDGDGGKEVAIGLGWIDNPLDRSYVMGDIRVFKLNTKYVTSPPSTQEKKKDVSTTTSSKPPVKKTTTTTTQPVEEEVPAQTAVTTNPQEKPQARSTGIILIIAGIGLFLLIIALLIFFLVLRKKPPKDNLAEISKT